MSRTNRRGGLRAGASRQGYRALLKQRAREFYQRHAIWTCQKMAAGRAEIEWRVLVLTVPDTRSLTGRLLGDPIHERSALWAKRMGFL